MVPRPYARLVRLVALATRYPPGVNGAHSPCVSYEVSFYDINVSLYGMGEGAQGGNMTAYVLPFMLGFGLPD